jgi:hypothetical protein
MFCPRWKWKARTEKNCFSRNKRATQEAPYDFRKKGFEGGLASYSWSRL